MVATIDTIVDYGGNFRFASLTNLDWFEVPADQWGISYQQYELVTEGFLEAFRKRLETQESRSHGYTKTMLARLELAKRLFSELTRE